LTLQVAAWITALCLRASKGARKNAAELEMAELFTPNGVSLRGDHYLN
jgi:hypothetical protein